MFDAAGRKASGARTFRKAIYDRTRFWIRRYAPAEIGGTATALIAAAATYKVSHSLLAAAIAGSVGEMVGYYGIAALREVRHYYAYHKGHVRLRRVWLTAVHTIRGLAVEFAAAEFLDSLFVRPFLLYKLPLLFHNILLGWLVGKFTADGVFYITAAFGYELRKRLFTEEKQEEEL